MPVRDMVSKGQKCLPFLGVHEIFVIKAVLENEVGASQVSEDDVRELSLADFVLI